MKRFFHLLVLTITILSSYQLDAYFRRPESLDGIPAIAPGQYVDDNKLISRLVNFYQRGFSQGQNLGDSMWRIIFDTQHAKIHETFLRGDLINSGWILRDPSSNDIFFGIDCLSKTFNKKILESGTISGYSNTCLDSLIRFAEAIGAQTLDNPEGYYLPAKPIQTDEILSKIFDKLGVFPYIPNPYPNEIGVLSSIGVVSYRVPQAMYQAYRIKELVKDIPNPKVLEIGAGVGRTAYYARLMGISDYTIVDLPMTLMCSGYFIGRTLGEDQIQISGESMVNSHEKVKFFTPIDFLNNDTKYDLIINVDSMTEMDEGVARTYFEHIRKSTGIFLSINHEINPFRVKDIIKDSNDVALYTRHPYWMRNGYVEELVRFK